MGLCGWLCSGELVWAGVIGDEGMGMVMYVLDMHEVINLEISH